MTESIAISGAESTFLAPEPVSIPVLSNAQQRVSVQMESLADQIGAQAVQTNIQNQMVTLSQGGGFDVDQTNLTTMIGYRPGFNQYTNQNQLQDSSNWYVARTIYRVNVPRDNRRSLNLLTATSQSKMQDMISSQYNR